MSEESKSHLLSAETQAEIEHWLKKYPADQRQSAVLSALHAAQDQNGGWLSRDLMDAVADYLGMPRVAVYEVATFYTMYDLKPVGQHKIGLCTSISCKLQGSEKIGEHLKQRLGIKQGETTPDGRITLKWVECLGACRNGPVVRVGRDYHENLTPEKIDALLASLEEKA